jgi:hypothetical protein
VVYHGTNLEFNEFDYSETQKNDVGFVGKGFYFTPKESLALAYAERQHDRTIWSWGDNEEKNKSKVIVKSFFLSIKNAKVVNEPEDIGINYYKSEIGDKLEKEKIVKISDNLKKQGYQGVIWHRDNCNGCLNGRKHWEYVAFEPNQIKLADGSNTTFDGNNPDIRFDKGGHIKPLVSFTKQDIRNYAENVLKDFDYEYVGYSDTNGHSMYFRVDDIKIRFSDHSVTNIDRIHNEVHFNLFDGKKIGTTYGDFSINQKLLSLKYNLGDKNILYHKRPMIMPSGKTLDAFGYSEIDKMELGGQTQMQHNKIEKVMGEFKRGELKTSTGRKVTDKEQAIAIALSEAGISRKMAEGGKITQFEIEAMKRYIESPQSNEFLVNSYKKVLAKFGVDTSNLDLEKFPKGKYIDPYNFSGYEYQKEKNVEMGVSFLLWGEYELVSKAIFEKDYSMWLFYNYLGRINISFDACNEWLQQAQDYFEYTMPIPIYLLHTPKAKDGRSYAMWFGVPKSQVAEKEARISRPIKFGYKGTYYYNEIGMVGNFDYQGSGWGTYYKEQKTGLLIPEYTQTSFHFNTLIHEFAHCFDFQSQLISNIEKYEGIELAKSKGDVVINTTELTELERELYGNSLAEKPDTIARPITNHFDFFVDSLIKILRASASGKIPLTQLYEQQALDVQTALSGVYGDLLLEQRERKRREAEEIKRDDEVRENTRFTWQSNFVEDIRDYATQKAKQSSLKDKISKSNKSKPFTLTEIIEFDNLITTYVEDVFKGYMIKHPSKAPSLLEAIKKMKFETNRIINNHYDNIRNKFVYGFKPTNELEIYILNNCDVKDFKDYKTWKECAKTKLQSKS